ncbi:MAG: hypothetical protein WBA51_18035 [Erythrobacter sp.]
MNQTPLPAIFEDRVRDLKNRLPHFSADVSFYASHENSRKGPVPNSFGCPCKLDRDSNHANDARILFEKDWVELGTVAWGDFFFVFGEEAAEKFRNAGRFFLWEGQIIAEATVV